MAEGRFDSDHRGYSNRLFYQAERLIMYFTNKIRKYAKKESTIYGDFVYCLLLNAMDRTIYYYNSKEKPIGTEKFWDQVFETMFHNIKSYGIDLSSAEVRFDLDFSHMKPTNEFISAAQDFVEKIREIEIKY